MLRQILQLGTAFLFVVSLVFIHELGHYIVAKWMGIPVERFSIGMGPSLFSKTWGKETWQIGCIPFGGFVEIRSLYMLEEDMQEQGMVRAPAWRRFLVLIAGSCFNILFAFFCFSAVWFCGGFGKAFHEVSPFCGHLESGSAWESAGLQAGDKVLALNGKNVQSFEEVFAASCFAKKGLLLDLVESDYVKRSFCKTTKSVMPRLLDDGKISYGKCFPSGFVIYQKSVSDTVPAAISELIKGDRIIWANHRPIFSIEAFEEVLQGESVCLHVQKPDGSILGLALERALVIDLLKEFDDMHSLLDLIFDPESPKEGKECWWLPCMISDRLVVTKVLEKALSNGLSEGDRILKIQDVPVSSLLDCVRALQTRKLFLIVDREELPYHEGLCSESAASLRFEYPFLQEGLYDLAQKGPSILGEQNKSGLIFLRPIELMLWKDLFHNEFLEYERLIWNARSGSFYEEVHFDVMRKKAAHYGVGGLFKDLQVLWKKDPWSTFRQEFLKNVQFLKMLFFGLQNVRITGPVGLLKHVYHESAADTLRVVFLAGSLSLQLGILNLLPIPVLDGGQILYLLLEKVFGRGGRGKIIQDVFSLLVIVFWVIFLWYSVAELFSLWA